MRLLAVLAAQAVLLVALGILSIERLSSTSVVFGISALVVLFAVAYRLQQKFLARYQWWKRIMSGVMMRDREIHIEDFFTLSHTSRRSDRTVTYLFSYIVSREVMYQIHPFIERQFMLDEIGKGSVLSVTVIEEQSQFKIIDYRVIKLCLSPPLVYTARTSGVIAGKYCGSRPLAIDANCNPRYPMVVTDPLQKLKATCDVRPKIVDRRITTGKHPEKFFFRINCHFEEVSPEDFLHFKFGDEVTFFRLPLN